MNASPITASVLLPSYRRPARLATCLQALANQTRLPDQVLVVWQADDIPTRDTVNQLATALPFRLDVLHLPAVGIVPAENLALAHATGDIIALTDDDAVPPPGWLERHLNFYADPTVGAVGGPADNHLPDGTPYPRRSADPVGRLTWFGRVIGHMHDHPPEWRFRSPVSVDHLVGYNLSLRRAAFDRFETGLRPYWQGFELDVCLQVAARGYRVMFDFGNVVEHHPTSGGHTGDSRLTSTNPAYNLAFVLAKHTRSEWQRMMRIGYLLLVGSVQTPGLLGAVVGWRRFGNMRREGRLLRMSWAAMVAGWRAGTARRA